MPYDGATLLADTSAWASIRKKAAPQSSRDVFLKAIDNGQIRSSPVVRLEMIWGARTKKEAEEKERRISVPELALSPDIIDRAMIGLTKMIAQPHSVRKVPIPDALIAATAQATGVGVLHYDEDFNILSEVFGIKSAWVAPKGSIR